MDKINTYSLTCESFGTPKEANGFFWGPGVRNVYILHYCLSGRGYYKVGEKKHTVEAGQCFLILPHTYVHYYPDPDEPWEYTWVDFYGREAAELLEKCSLSTAAPVSEKTDGRIAELFLALGESRSAPPSVKDVRNSAYLRLIIAELIERHPANSVKDVRGSIARRGAEYIEANLHSPALSVEAVAEHLCISRSSLYRHFISEFHLTPIEYVAERRIKRACLLLTESELSVKNIAYSVGISDSLYFSKVFSRIMRTSPTKYRAKARGLSAATSDGAGGD